MIVDLDGEHRLGDRRVGAEVGDDLQRLTGGDVRAGGVRILDHRGGDDVDVAGDDRTLGEVAVEVLAERPDRIAGSTVEHELGVVDHDRPIADLAHRRRVVGHEHDRPAIRLELLDPAQALRLEQLVPDREHFVDQQHVRVEIDGDGEAEPDVHPRRVVLDRLVDELGELGEGDDVVEDPVDLTPAHAVERGVDVHVLADRTARGGTRRQARAATPVGRGPAPDPGWG